MRTIERERLQQISQDPHRASKALTGFDPRMLERHLQTAAKLMQGGALNKQDVLWLAQQAKASNVPMGRFKQVLKAINTEPNPQKRAELYARGVGGNDDAARVGLQMATTYLTTDTANQVHSRLESNRPKVTETLSELDPYWDKRYKEEQGQEQSRRAQIEAAIREATGYVRPEDMTLEERQIHAQKKANALANRLENDLDKSRTLREEVAANVHAASVLDEMHDLGLRAEHDTFSGVLERDRANQQAAEWRANE